MLFHSQLVLAVDQPFMPAANAQLSMHGNARLVTQELRWNPNRSQVSGLPSVLRKRQAVKAVYTPEKQAAKPNQHSYSSGAHMLQPESIAEHYSLFRVRERILLTGHSHQAWPDAGFEGQKRAWLDAAEHVDDKWGPAFQVAQRVRRGFAELLDDLDGEYTLGSNTFELVVRWLSALPLRQRPRLVTTDGEFHSQRRLLARLEEEGLEVVRVPALPAATVGERLAAAVDGRTSAVLASAIFYQTAHIAGGLNLAAEAAHRVGAEIMIDAYHVLNALPFSLREQGLQRAFVVGGGYKYLQLGEGNCFLRYPKGCQLRPVATGWFADYASLERPVGAGPVSYQLTDGCLFAGATYDTTSSYRAAAVMDFFQEQGMTPQRLRKLSQHQCRLLRDAFSALQLPPDTICCDQTVPLSELGAFVVFESPKAGEICAKLREHGVWTDYRGNRLRVGPAPYVTDGQIEQGIEVLGKVVQNLLE